MAIKSKRENMSKEINIPFFENIALFTCICAFFFVPL